MKDCMREKQKTEKRKPYGIIWDMDNTILQSHIDFRLLHREVCGYLAEKQLLIPDYEKKTTAEVLMEIKQLPHYRPEWEQNAWQIVGQIEALGMKDAQLEPGVEQALVPLSSQTHMVVLTNNSQIPAELGLARNGVDCLFDGIYGRESVPDLKPSSLGVEEILAQFPWVPPANWVFIGDAGIDARAAIGAGVAFASYTGSRKEDLTPYQPVLQFECWQPDCGEKILAYLQGKK